MNRANAPGEDAAGGGGGGAGMLEEGGWRPERRQGRGGEGGQTEAREINQEVLSSRYKVGELMVN